MARRVIGAGHGTFTVCDSRRGPCDELAALGAQVPTSPADAARAAEVVTTILPADRELKEVVFDDQGLLRGFSSGKILIDMTTGTALARSKGRS